jgi:hypothetical protein
VHGLQTMDIRGRQMNNLVRLVADFNVELPSLGSIVLFSFICSQDSDCVPLVVFLILDDLTLYSRGRGLPIEAVQE